MSDRRASRRSIHGLQRLLGLAMNGNERLRHAGLRNPNSSMEITNSQFSLEDC